MVERAKAEDADAVLVSQVVAECPPGRATPSTEGGSAAAGRLVHAHTIAAVAVWRPGLDQPSRDLQVRLEY
ncbi:hypothetical protein GWI34_09200 [Actinomadura sp. DSM 109109]|nr:hypothetical protein [Actinomadura lepetitiana]